LEERNDTISSWLNGLRGTPNYGEAVAAQSQLSLESETENKKSALKQKQDENARENQFNQQKSKTTASNMRRQTQKKSSQINQAKAHSANNASSLAMNRKKHWDVKSSAIQGLLGSTESMYT
jgi:hypothetical protein